MQDERKFIMHINDNYDELKRKFKVACSDLQLILTDDIFQDTILKCYESIEKRGKLNDSSPYGCESYLFQALKQNIKREAQYARNTKRDSNINSDNIYGVYEEWLTNNASSERAKLLNDLYKDFSVLYLLYKVEENFDNEHFYLFRVKYLNKDITYKALQDKTKCKKVRQKVVDVKQWLKNNVTNEEIKEAFLDIYGNLL